MLSLKEKKIKIEQFLEKCKYIKYSDRYYYRKIGLIIAFISVSIIIGIFSYMYKTGDIYTMFKEPEELDDVTWHKWNDKKTKRASFVSETSYDGTSDAPYILYEYPFRSDGENVGEELEQAYNSNKNLKASFTDDEIKAYMDHANNYINLIWGSDYKTIAGDSDAFINDYLMYYNGIYYDDNTVDEEGKDMEAEASYLAQFYVDNEISATVRWVTDDSLFYRSMYSYTTRGAAYVTFTSNLHPVGEECDALYDLYGFTFKYGEEIGIMANVGFSAWSGEYYKLGAFETITLDNLEKLLLAR